MARPRRAPKCGHGEITHGKGLCPKCYHAARYLEKKDHITAVNAAWVAANPEKARANRAAWREANRERVERTNREYQEANRDRERARKNAWLQAHPEWRRNRDSQRRARKRGQGASLTAAGWRAILEEFDHKCAYCNLGDLPLEQEHMTPLARGGAHDARNVVPACGPCNRTKHARTAFEWVGPDAFRVTSARSAA